MLELARSRRPAAALAALALFLCAAAVAPGCIGEDEAPHPPLPPQTATPPVPATALPPGMALPTTAPAATHPAALDGAYQLEWIEGRAGRQPMPATLLAQMPGCVWGRWLWEFGPTGSLRVHNELLCEDPQLGTGVCRAEFETQVAWQLQAFVVPAPVTARSQFVALRPANVSWAASGGRSNSTTIRCNVNLSDVTARMTEVVPGPAPNRPQSVTLDIGDGERIHLAATELDVDHAQIMAQHAAGALAP